MTSTYIKQLFSPVRRLRMLHHNIDCGKGGSGQKLSPFVNTILPLSIQTCTLVHRVKHTFIAEMLWAKNDPVTKETVLVYRLY